MTRTLRPALTRSPMLLLAKIGALCLIAIMARPGAAQDAESQPQPDVTHLQEWSRITGSDVAAKEGKWYDPAVAAKLSGWQKIQISKASDNAAATDSAKSAYYWTPFQAPEFGEEDHLWLEIGGLSGQAEVYLNGQPIEAPKHKSAAGDKPSTESQADDAKENPRPAHFDLTSKVQPGKNDLMIRVASENGDAGMAGPVSLQSTANWVDNPSFNDGFERWRLYIHESEESVEPTFDPGYYLDDQSIRLEAGPGEVLILDQHTDHVMQTGHAYRLSVRYRQDLEGPATDVVPLRLMWMTYPKRGKRQAHDKLWVSGPMESTDGWQELTGIFNAVEDYTGFRIGVIANVPGVYHIDEFSVSPVDASGDTAE